MVLVIVWDWEMLNFKLLLIALALIPFSQIAFADTISVTGSDSSLMTDSVPGTECLATVAGGGPMPTMRLSHSSGNGICQGVIFDFQIYAIPDGSTVNGAWIEYQIESTNNDSVNPRTCDWKHFTYGAAGNTASARGLFHDEDNYLGNVTDILENTTSCQNPVGSSNIDIFDTGNFKQLFEDEINGDNEITLGFTFTDNIRDEQAQAIYLVDNNSTLTIDYTPPVQYQLDQLKAQVEENTNDISSIQEFINSLIAAWQNLIN